MGGRCSEGAGLEIGATDGGCRSETPLLMVNKENRKEETGRGLKLS